MNWDAAFIDLPAIRLPDGRMLATLSDCRAYILALSEAEQSQEHWQAATAVLIRAAEHGGGYLMIARITISIALSGPVPGPPSPRSTKTDAWKAKRAARKVRVR